MSIDLIWIQFLLFSQSTFYSRNLVEEENHKIQFFFSFYVIIFRQKDFRRDKWGGNQQILVASVRYFLFLQRNLRTCLSSLILRLWLPWWTFLHVLCVHGIVLHFGGALISVQKKSGLLSQHSLSLESSPSPT